MGVVYKAEGARLHRKVAFRLLRPEALTREELKARFLKEADTATVLDDPNICTIHEIDQA